MKLSKAERMILINQFLMLKKTEINKGIELKFYDSSKYDNYIEILQKGYSGLYSDIFAYIGEEQDKYVGDFVLDVLDMYRRAYYTYEILTEEEQESIKDIITFRGFDLNDETEYYSICEFIIKKRGYKDILVASSLNTHYPTISRYELQLSKHKNNMELINSLDGLKEVFS